MLLWHLRSLLMRPVAVDDSRGEESGGITGDVHVVKFVKRLLLP